MAFEKGQSGNPGGRPKEKLFKEALTLAVKRADGDKTKLARIAEALVEKAAEGDVMAAREVMDRIDGKAVQAIEHSGEIETSNVARVPMTFDTVDAWQAQYPNKTTVQ